MASPRCEDFPACGHGLAPHGDGGGCPDEDGRFDCVLCGRKLVRNAPSCICAECRRNPPPQSEMDDEEGY